jgi:hypothetical protein
MLLEDKELLVEIISNSLVKLFLIDPCSIEIVNGGGSINVKSFTEDFGLLDLKRKIQLK